MKVAGMCYCLQVASASLMGLTFFSSRVIRTLGVRVCKVKQST